MSVNNSVVAIYDTHEVAPVLQHWQWDWAGESVKREDSGKQDCLRSYACTGGGYGSSFGLSKGAPRRGHTQISHKRPMLDSG
jgi:hypothetical protein